MIERLVRLSLARRRTVLFVALLIALYGVFSATRLRLEAYPDISDTTVQVTTQALGLSSEDVEQQITTPLERALAATPGLASMRSSSTFGLSLITLLFRDGVDSYFARQRVLELVNQVALPAGMQPQLGALTGPTDEIYRYTLESDSKNLMELSEIQRWKVIPALQRTPGIANIDSFGGFTLQYQVEVDPNELARYGLALNDVINAITANSANAGGSRITRGEQSYVVRGVGLVRSLDDIGAIIITQKNGAPVLIRDIGRLTYAHQERGGILGKNGNPDTVQGNIQMLKGEDPSTVLRNLKTRIAALNKDMVADDVRITPYIDRDGLVNSTIDKVGHTVAEGVGLVFVVLILFLGSPIAATVVAITIPLSLLVAFILMNLTHLPANLLSLGSIDFGVIVDGAIVMTEAILLERERAPTLPLRRGAIAALAARVAAPIFFATLVIISAYLPLLGLERTEAKLFSPIAYTISYAFCGALASSILLTPVLAYSAFRKPAHVFVNPVVEALRSAYRHALDALLEAPYLAYIVAAICLASVGALAYTAGRDFLPELDEGSLWLQVQLPSGISLEKASEMASDLRREIKTFPEVENVISQVGRSDSRTDQWTPSHIEMPVTLKPYDAWPGHESKREFVRRLREKLDTLPGYQIGISQPIIDNVNDMIGGAHSALVLRVVGQDLKEARRIGANVVDVLKTIPGTSEASIFQEPPIPQIAITVDRAAAARFGVSASDVATLISKGVGGEPISQIYVDDRIYDIVARFPVSARSSPENIGNLTLNAGGAQIPLSQIAHIEYRNGESIISHEENKRSLTVRIDYKDRDLTSWLAEARARIDADVKYDPAKFHLEWAGQFENQQRAQTRLTIIVLVVIALMFIILLSGFGKLRQVMIILGVVPLAMLGGLIALHVRGEVLNVASGVGFLALFGVAVQNGIIMVSNINRVRAFTFDLRTAVLEGASERLRPVLMTSTVATFGMVPAALATGVGSDVQRALATIVVGGLYIATALTLFLVPIFYYILERRVEKRAPKPVEEE
ncbi:MAG: efflux RND transporter permease subunit [Hyphomicrobiales bacterium]|nr:efflux RND transporter permease subunit [Hyphomicrobiales bacterium]